MVFPSAGSIYVKHKAIGIFFYTIDVILIGVTPTSALDGGLSGIPSVVVYSEVIDWYMNSSTPYRSIISMTTLLVPSVGIRDIKEHTGTGIAVLLLLFFGFHFHVALLGKFPC